MHYWSIDWPGEHPATKFTYHAFERHPLTGDAVCQLNYPQVLQCPSDHLLVLHQTPYDASASAVSFNFTLSKTDTDYLQGLPEAWKDLSYDLLFYDAFAPNSQPELWTPEALRLAYDALAPGGVLVTYCAKGQFKRDLKEVGFQVEALPGPPGKREMTRATKNPAPSSEGPG